MRKRHALVLYEFLLDALSRTRKDFLRVVVAIGKLYDLLGVNEDMSYKFFNRDVIKPSIQEVTKHTDINVTYDTHRQERKVIEIIFVVEKKEVFQLYLDFDTERLDQVERLEDARAAKRGSDLQSLLEHYGVGQRKARELIESYEEDRIRGNIEHLLKREKEGKKVKNTAAYLVKAIQEDYRPKKSPKEQQEERDRVEKTRAVRAKKEKEKLEEEWKRFRQQRLRERFVEQPAEWQDEKRKRFVEKVKGEGRGSILRSSLQKRGFESPMVEAMFFSELRDELLTLPEETEFEQYLEYRERKAVSS